MTRSIAEAIALNTDLDIIKAFDSLQSQAAQILAIEQVIDACRRGQPHLVKHRYLLTLARLLEELVSTAPYPDRGNFRGLFQQCLDLGLIEKPLHSSSETTGLDLATLLPSRLRTKAAHLLREAIITLCPNPENVLSASKSATWSFRNASIRVLAPVRLDLGMGGISDIPPYSLERYGNCVNVPIRLDGNFPVETSVEVLTEPVIRFESKDLGVKKTYHDILEFEDQREALRFHREIVRFFMNRIIDLETTEELYSFLGGGLSLQTHSHLPFGTGLGVSSLLPCAIIKALGNLFDITLTPQTLFVASVYLENVIGIGGGWEDATAIYPGVKLMESFPETPLSPQIRHLSLSDLSIQKIKNHLVLVYTGIPKQGQAFFETMVERYCLRDTRTLRAIEHNNALNSELAESLSAGDLASIGQVMQSQWENWKVLSDGKCTNHQIDRLFAEAAPCVYGARMNGAGQGGCAMFVAREGKKEELGDLIRSILGDSVTFYRWGPIL